MASGYVSVQLSMTVEDASRVEDALSYWLIAAKDNFGAGYERGSEEDAEARTTYRRVERVAFRLGALRQRAED